MKMPGQDVVCETWPKRESREQYEWDIKGRLTTKGKSSKI